MSLSSRTAALAALALALAAPASALPTPASALRLVAAPLAWTPIAPGPDHRIEHASGAELRFDRDLGVYRVEGNAGLFYFDDSFLRVRAAGWQRAETPTGPWSPQRVEWVPIRLRIVHHLGGLPRAEASDESER